MVGAEDLALTCRALEEAGRRGDLPGARARLGPLLSTWEHLRGALEGHL